MTTVTHATVATGTDAGTGEIHKAQWNATHVVVEDDPIAVMFGAADTAYEFATSSFTGLTSFGTLVAEDANTSVPDHYYARNTQNANPYWGGRLAAVTPPFTAIVRLYIPGGTVASLEAGLMVAPAALTSGFEVVTHGNVGGQPNMVGYEKWTSNGVYNSTSYMATSVGPPIYLAVKCTTTTNVDYYFSHGGYVWKSIAIARNPSLTLTQVGPAIAAQNTAGAVAAWEFLRIWNSAKTFLYQ